MASIGSVSAGGARAAISPNVWLFGDSITQGAGDASENGFRKALADRKLAMGYRFDLVGSRAHGTFVDKQHDGLPNSQIAEASIRIPTLCGPGMLVEHARLVGDMHGVNDARQGGFNAATVAGLQAEKLEQIYTLCRPRRISVTTCTPVNPALDATAATNVVALNAQFPAVWTAFEAAHPGVLVQWDAYAALGGAGADFASNYTDAYHPNATGYAILATAYLSAIEHALAWL